MLSPVASRGANHENVGTPELIGNIQILSQPYSPNDDNSLLELLDGRIHASHYIRQLLVSSPDITKTQDAFRLNRGFESVLDALSFIQTSLERGELNSSDQSACVEYFHACAIVLSAALHGHYGNRRYFRLRMRRGGWKYVQAACLPWIDNSSIVDRASLDKLFGSLLVCGLNDDSTRYAFGDVRRALEACPHAGTPSDTDYSGVSHSFLNPEQSSVLEKALVQALRSSSLAHNAEALQIMFNLWRRLSETHDCQRSDHFPILVCVPRLLEKVANLSFHNLVSLRRTDILSSLLQNIARSEKLGKVPELFRLCQELLRLGITNQEHARQLYQGARTSKPIAELLSRTLESPGAPPFIHFDLSIHGYTSVELPSIGKSFPPMGKKTGYTIALWLNVLNFDPNAHTTIFGALDASHTCFVLLYIERGTRNIILQTSASSSSRPSVRFKSCSFVPQHWYHVVVVHQRPKTIASSRASLYVNGEFLEQVKSNYPLSAAERTTSRPKKEETSIGGSAIVQAFLGTPQDLAADLKPGATSTQWRLASAHLISDTLSDDMIAIFYRLGPRYFGNYQDCLGSFQTYEASAALNLRNENLHYGREDKSDIVVAIRQKGSIVLPEDCIMISFSPLNALFGHQEDNVDDEQFSVVQNLSKSSKKVLRNILRAGRHSVLVNGTCPSIEVALRQKSSFAVLNGDPVPVIPQLLDDSAWRLGGCAAVVLSLFAAAEEPPRVRSSLLDLCAAIKNSWRNSEAMERDNGFGVLANLLQDKIVLVERTFLDGLKTVEDIRAGRARYDAFCIDILRTLLEFVGYTSAHRESSIINNPLAYRVLIVDLNLWRSLGTPVQELYYQQFLDLGLYSKYRRFNAKRLTRMRVAKRWLDGLKTDTFREDTMMHFVPAFKFILSAALSPDTLRATALTITFGLYSEDSDKAQAPGSESGPRSKTSRARGQTLSTNTSDFNAPRGMGVPQIGRRQAMSRIFEMLADIICQPENTDYIRKFARAVTNKWLLYLIDDKDPYVVSIAVKLISRLLVIHGASYAEKFAGKTGGFEIMRHYLGRFWSEEGLWWSCFSVLFGKDVADVDYTRNVDLYGLIDTFTANGKDLLLYSNVLPVLMTMLKHGLKSLVIEPDKPDGLYVDKISGENGSIRPSSTNQNISPAKKDEPTPEKVVMFHNILRFLADLHGKSQSFRDFAVSSGYVQELLHVLFPVVVGSDNFGAEAELQAGDEPRKTNDGGVLIKPLSTFPRGTKIVRATLTERPKDETPKRAPAPRRMSSYVLLSSEWQQAQRPVKALQGPCVGPSARALLVEELLEIVTAVFSEQLLYRKDFLGLGLFMKVPPGLQEHQAFFETFILRNTVIQVHNTIKLNTRLLWEPRVLTNLSRFSAHLREATYEGWFIDGAETILDFLAGVLEYLQLPEINALKSVRLCTQAIGTIAANLMRTVLLRLSELGAIGSPAQIVSFIEKLTAWQAVLWPDDNGDDEYFHHISFLLYQQLEHEDISVRMVAANSWRMLMVQRPIAIAALFQDASTAKLPMTVDGFNKLMELDNETFLYWAKDQHRELNQLFAPLSTGWNKYVNEENRSTRETLSSRVTKRREKLKQWQAECLAAEDVVLRHNYGARHWQSNIQASELIKVHRAIQDQQDNWAFNTSTWGKMDRMLRGPCGLFEETQPLPWRLDQTEGRNRMRLRLIPVIHEEDSALDPKTKHPSNLSRNRSAASSISKSHQGVGSRRARSTSETGDLPSERLFPNTHSGPDHDDREGSIHQDDSFELIDAIENDLEEYEDKNRKVMRSLQRGDQVSYIHNIARVIGLEAYEGLLIQGKSHLYLIDHLLQRSDGEIVNVWQAPMEERDPYVQLISGHDNLPQQRHPHNKPNFEARSWSWDEILSISKRRFLFRDVAIELFFVDGLSYLLICKSPEFRDDLYQKLQTQLSKAADNANIDIVEDAWRSETLRHPEDRSQTLGSKFSGVFTQHSSNPATKKWIKGEISNFSYLMMVNTMAGRTFNDLTQYPVFPWVIADYTSSELNLSNPRTFRDLTKPMGCQSAERQEGFRERFKSFAEMGDDTSTAFHYGTHYSSAMIVTSYLIRLRPYTQSYLLLQGGSFDHPDRLFYDIRRTWQSASQDNMTDVRELIPEFYCLPEFLVNSNDFEFGARQGDGGVVDSVVLPPWAKNDPKIFIAKQREALESDYVSKHLHHWIDLVFGQKQRGEAAVEATNVFHHLSYHGAKDLDSITNKAERLATIGIIHNFGQTPHQVFSRAHPPREDAKGGIKELEGNVENLTRLPFPLLETQEGVRHIACSGKDDRIFCSGAFRINLPPAYDRYLEWGFVDGSIRFYTSESKTLLGLSEHVHQTQISALLVIDSKTLVTAGVDSTIAVWTVVSSPKSVTLIPKQNFFGHNSAINVLAASRAFATLMSASIDGQILLWDLNRLNLVRKLKKDEAVVCARVNDVTADLLICHKQSLALFTLNGDRIAARDIIQPNSDDAIHSCAFYEGSGNKYLTRQLIFTGHQRGIVNVWHKAIRDGGFIIDHLKTLNHFDQSGSNIPSAITNILPVAKAVYTGDDDGRLYEWNCIQRQ